MARFLIVNSISVVGEYDARLELTITIRRQYVLDVTILGYEYTCTIMIRS